VQLYVNRGIGQTSSFRLDASPEVTLATLRAAPA
jgi:predicted MPP superfamily phosphohydrolase